MLEIYVKPEKDIHHINDYFFDTHTYDKVFGNSDLIKVLEDVEGIIYLGNGRLKSKFTEEPIGLSSISTGSKTLLNIIAYSNEIFDIVECGYNVLQRIFNLKDGKVFCKERTTIADNIINDFKVISKTVTVINSMEELEEWWNNYEMEI